MVKYRMRKPNWLIWLEFLPVALILPIIALIPHRVGLALGHGLGIMLYWLLANYRAISHVNLRIAFGPALSETQARDCARAGFMNAVQTFFEFARLYHMDREQVIRYTLQPSGYDEYKAALSQGRGVIAVSAHFGNWYWPVVCAAMEGFKVNVIVRPLDNPLLNRLMNRVFERWDIRVIPRRRAVVAALAALRRGETVALMVDQNTAAHGRFVPFFGVPAATMQGLPLLHRGSRAEVLGIHSLRLGARHQIRMHWLKEYPTDEYAGLVAVNRYFESIIDKNKEAYFWMHPRWKKRPPHEPSLYPGLKV